VSAHPKETVFIVEDDPAIREGLSDLLESAGLKTEHFISAEDFLRGWKKTMPGCLVLDVRLPGMTGMELQGRLKELGLAIPVIIMTAHGDMPMVRKALKVGAVEFLIKPFRDEEVILAVEQAFRMDREQRQAGNIVTSIKARLNTLTEREQQVLELVTEGLMNKEIADRLYLSVATVKLHRGQVMKKMKAESLADLVKMWGRMHPHSRVH
jgi:FixJ family two-component response regulator